jgi:hypothetical protein
MIEGSVTLSMKATVSIKKIELLCSSGGNHFLTGKKCKKLKLFGL